MKKGKYLYCIANSNKEITLGRIGIEKNNVYTIPYRKLCAVVHDCPPIPYKSEDKEKIKSWIIAHEKTIETAWERFGSVLPLKFDTIIQSDHEMNATANLKKWLKDDYDNLKQKLKNLSNMAEFTVQIFWDPKIIGKGLTEKNEEIKKLKKEIESKSMGIGYMYKQKLENLIKKELEKEANKYFRDFYDRIQKYVDDPKIERTKRSQEETQMLMNLSCLIPKEKSKILGDELEKINNQEGFSVRFTGPWPPYSFV